jgi:outer membrane murein-binding lipoprotein Lpp
MNTRSLAPESRAGRIRAHGHVRVFVVCAAVMSLTSLAGCVSVRPKVVSEKTQLENQILGNFDKLENDLILASSVRSEGAPGAELSPAHREALLAVMNRQFRRDDVEDLKTRKIAGESLQGTLALRETPEVRENGTLKVQATKVIAEENRDREVIMKRVLDMYSGLGPEDLPEVRKMMYELNVAQSFPGTPIEVPEQGFIEKPDPKLDEARRQAEQEAE